MSSSMILSDVYLQQVLCHRCSVRAADDIALLENSTALDKTLLHSLERAAAVIGLHVNAHKTEYMYLNQRGDISTLNGSSLKLVDMFTYQGSSVSSTETDINTRQAKAWTAIDKLSVIWKSDRTDKIKRNFFQAAIVRESAPHKAAAVHPLTTHHENYPS